MQEADFQPTKTSFLKSAVPSRDDVEGDWSAWNSGKPKDWGKKLARGDDKWPYSSTTTSTGANLAQDASQKAALEARPVNEPNADGSAHDH